MTPKEPAKRILIADPDESIRTDWRTALEESGYQVLQAVNGLDAVKLVEAHQVDLAILEIIMPELDGLGAILSIRRQRIDCLILATANPRAHRYLRIAKLLGAATLPKPADALTLLAIVTDLLGEHGPTR